MLCEGIKSILLAVEFLEPGGQGGVGLSDEYHIALPLFEGIPAEHHDGFAFLTDHLEGHGREKGGKALAPVSALWQCIVRAHDAVGFVGVTEGCSVQHELAADALWRVVVSKKLNVHECFVVCCVPLALSRKVNYMLSNAVAFKKQITIIKIILSTNYHNYRN